MPPASQAVGGQPDQGENQRSATARPEFASWYTLGAVTLLYLLAQVDRKVIAIVAEPIKLEMNLTDGQIGALTGLMYGIPNALMLLPMGFLLDRYNRRNIISGMLALWSAACAATGFASTYLHLVVSRAAIGVAESGAASGGLSMIADLFPSRWRPVATGIFQSATPVGTILCFTVVAWIAAQFGWRAAFIASGVPGIILALVIFTSVREPKRGAVDRPAIAETDEAEEKPTLMQALRFAATERAALHYILGPGLVSSASTAIGLWAPSFMIRYYGLTVAEAGYLLAISAGAITALALAASGPVVTRFARDDEARLALVPIFTVLVSVVFAAMVILAPSVPMLIAGLCLFAVFNYVYLSIGYSLLLGITPIGMRGMVLAVELIAANLLGYAGGPFIVGLLSDAIGGDEPLRWALLASLPLYLWGAFHFYLGRRAIIDRSSG